MIEETLLGPDHHGYKRLSALPLKSRPGEVWWAPYLKWDRQQMEIGLEFRQLREKGGWCKVWAQKGTRNRPQEVETLRGGET